MYVLETIKISTSNKYLFQYIHDYFKLKLSCRLYLTPSATILFQLSSVSLLPSSLQGWLPSSNTLSPSINSLSVTTPVYALQLSCFSVKRILGFPFLKSTCERKAGYNKGGFFGILLCVTCGEPKNCTWCFFKLMSPCSNCVAPSWWAPTYRTKYMLHHSSSCDIGKHQSWPRTHSLLHTSAAASSLHQANKCIS